MRSIVVSSLLVTAAAIAAHAQDLQGLAKMLDANASASAYARMCDEEPLADQLKADTMMLLAVSGLPPHNVQLGSAKFNEVMRREYAATKSPKDVDCPVRIREARERLTETLGILQATRRQ